MENKRKEKKFKGFFAPIDAQLEICEEDVKKLDELLDGEKPSEVYVVSRNTAFVYYLLKDRFSFGDIEYWNDFNGEEDSIDFKIELNERIQRFNILSKRIYKINERMYNHLVRVKEEQGEDEMRKIIEEGYIPPVDFLNRVEKRLSDTFSEMDNESVVDNGAERQDRRSKRDPAFV